MRSIQLKIFNGRDCELHVEHEIGEFISRSEACTIANVSDSTLRRMIKAEMFPSPIQLFDGSHGFAIREFLKWIDTQQNRS